MSIVPNRSWSPALFGVGGWIRATLVLASAVAVAVLAGYLLGVRSWVILAGLGAGGLLVAGAALGFPWLRRTEPAAPPARPRLKVVNGGKTAPYDLAQDDSTDSQRYLM